MELGTRTERTDKKLLYSEHYKGPPDYWGSSILWGPYLGHGPTHLFGATSQCSLLPLAFWVSACCL